MSDQPRYGDDIPYPYYLASINENGEVHKFLGVAMSEQDRDRQMEDMVVKEQPDSIVALKFDRMARLGEQQ